MKRPYSPLALSHRTPKRPKLSHPHDSPSNPFSPTRPFADTQQLPLSTSVRHHLPLRFQIKGTRTYRIVSVPRNYTFVHLQAVIEWLFRDVTDALPNRRASGRIASLSRTTQSKLSSSSRKGKNEKKLVTVQHFSPSSIPRKIRLAALAGDDGPKFKVLSEVEVYESKFNSAFLEGVITSGKLVAQLSRSQDPFKELAGRATPSSSDDEEGEEVEVGNGSSWLWERCEEFTVGNAWPDTVDPTRAVVYHQHRHQEIHITIPTQSSLPSTKLKKLTGSRQDPYVFIAKGTAQLEFPDADPSFRLDFDSDRFGYGYGGSNDPDPQDLELTFWNAPMEKGHRGLPERVSFAAFFKSTDPSPVKEEEEDEYPRTPTKPRTTLAPPSIAKKLVFPDLRVFPNMNLNLDGDEDEEEVDQLSSPAARSLLDDMLPPPPSSPCSEAPGLTFSSSSPSHGTPTDDDGAITPKSPDEQSARNYWLGIDQEDAGEEEPKTKKRAAYVVRSVLGDEMLSDDDLELGDEDEGQTLGLRRLPVQTPLRQQPRGYASAPASPSSPSSSPTKKSTLHHARSVPSFLHPTLDLFGPTPQPTSRLVRARLDHWVDRRLGRLTKKGLREGVLNRLDKGLEGDGEEGCLPVRDEGGEVDELDAAPGKKRVVGEQGKRRVVGENGKGKKGVERGKNDEERDGEDERETYYADHYFSCGAQRMRESSVEV